MTSVQADESGAHFVYNGDCISLMDSWANAKAFEADFVFADPPFNIGENYGDSHDAHDDGMLPGDFVRLINDFIYCAARLLKPGGVLAVNVPDDMVAMVLRAVDVAKEAQFFDFLLTRIDWCIWHYRFGQCVKTKFISSHTHCLIFRKGNEYQHTFNADSILVESDRHSKYNDYRTLESATPGMRVPLDVWCDIPRVVGNAAERVQGHPNQLPERYLDRVIRAYTNAGELILDPFGGTGTTGAVAKRLGRRSVLIEKNSRYCNDIIERINLV